MSPQPIPSREASSRPRDSHDRDFLLGLYERMVLIREFEDGVKFLFLEGTMPGTIHQCQGQEATAVGVCAALGEDDFITSTFRGHGHALAKGLSVEELLFELFGAVDRLLQGQGRVDARRQHGQGHGPRASRSWAAASPWPRAWPWR